MRGQRLASLPSEHQVGETNAWRIDRLLSWCPSCAVLYGAFALAEQRWWRTGAVVLLFLIVVPWLGKKWVNRAK
jgi:hypothetical protein